MNKKGQTIIEPVTGPAPMVDMKVHDVVSEKSIAFVLKLISVSRNM